MYPLIINNIKGNMALRYVIQQYLQKIQHSDVNDTRR